MRRDFPFKTVLAAAFALAIALAAGGCTLGPPMAPIVSINQVASVHDASVDIREVGGRPDRVVRISPGEWTGATAWSLGEPYFRRPGPQGGRSYSYAYGPGTGQFTYVFATGLPSVSKAFVSARLSSAHPTASAPAEWTSDVVLSVNGHKHKAKRVVADDGQGRVYSWELKPSELRPYNTISFAVPAGAECRHGLVIYYQAVNRPAPDYPITIRLWR